MNALLLASRNAHKVEEIRAVLGAQFRYLTLRDVADAPVVVEDADTFTGNATKKAVDLARWLSLSPRANSQPGPDFVLADDSGLAVDALGGQPGVYSARFAAMDSPRAGNAPDADNNAKLLRLLRTVPEARRTARFCCVLALVAVTPRSAHRTPHLFDGTCEGHILLASRGSGGFGYDPLFVPAGFELSFAELGEAVKNQVSHRARALQKLKAYLAALV